MIGITGYKGVLGTIMVAKLKERNQEFVNFEGDIRDFDSFYEWILSNNIDCLIHLASKVAVNEVANNLDQAYEINVGGTINLIKAIKKLNKPIYVFYASSSHVYASSSDLIKESDALSPLNSYGKTKFISEMMLTDFSQSHPFLSLCIGRIFSFYDASQQPPFLYATLLKRFQEEDLSQPFQLYGAHSTRDFLPATEVVELILKLVAIKADGIVNIASGKPIKIIDFVKNIAPVQLQFKIDENEKETHLNADISHLNKLLKS